VVNSVISNGQLVKDQAGILSLTGTNTYTQGTVIKGGAIRGVDGVNIPSSSTVTIDRGTVQTFGTVTRTFTGTGPGIAGQFNSSGYGFIGFDGYNPTGTAEGLRLNFGQVAGSTEVLTVNPVSTNTTFAITSFSFNLGADANRAITLDNNLDIRGFRSSVFINNISYPGFVMNVGQGTGAAGVGTVFWTGSLVDSGATLTATGGAVTKLGAGTLIYSGTSSSWTGAYGTVSVSGGTLALASGAVLTPKLLLVSGGTFDPTGAGASYQLDNPRILQVVGSNSFMGGNLHRRCRDGTRPRPQQLRRRAHRHLEPDGRGVAHRFQQLLGPDAPRRRGAADRGAQRPLAQHQHPVPRRHNPDVGQPEHDRGHRARPGAVDQRFGGRP
jgi:autotransporter-associated beta strand protein